MFHNIHAVTIESARELEIEWELTDIHRKEAGYPNREKCWKWTIVGIGTGLLEFLSNAYEQYIGLEPIFSRFQHLTREQRGMHHSQSKQEK